jgi:hypothetical protein
MLLLAILLPVLGTPSHLCAQAGYAASVALDEYLVKGSLLINIPKFVTWPASALPPTRQPLVVGVLGMNPFSDMLDDLAKAGQIQGRRIEVRYFKKVADVKGCHILYVSVSEGRRIPAVLSALKGQRVLTVSDIRDFVQKGGMVGLVVMDNRVQFDINQAAFRRAGLKVGSQLLQLAHQVVADDRK